MLMAAGQRGWAMLASSVVGLSTPARNPGYGLLVASVCCVLRAW
jgi:hypothetical protein